jgi:4-amino-4-deoxy-L-arabinose transferase-like glycosyltransferase
MRSDEANGRSTAGRLWDIAFVPGEWMLSRFSGLDSSRWPILWIIGLFLVQAVPATIIRASNLEEGRIIAIARGALEDGHWLTPFVYGERFAERPVLLSWIAALFGETTGGVTLWSLRIPHLCFFLVGTLLIYSLLRSVTGKSAAIFGALCWISMPVVAPKFINAEPDIVLSVLLFGAFCIWWQGTRDNNTTPGRWFCISILVALAGLTKGPQEVVYFTLGVGAYILLKQRNQIPAFITANIGAGLIIGGWYGLVYQPGDINTWEAHSRLTQTTNGMATVRGHLDFVKSLAVEFLPGSILIGPAIMIAVRRWRDHRDDLLVAAILYSVACTLVLLFWPGKVAARYAMPGTMTLAVICGLMFENWRRSHRRVIVSALVVTYVIFGGLLVRGWIVMPFAPRLFQESRIAGQAIAAILHERPGRLYIADGDSTDHNMLVYVRGPISAVSLDDLAALNTSAIAVLRPEHERALSQMRPELQLIDKGDVVSGKTHYKIVGITPRG